MKMKRVMALALCTVMMICAVQPAAAANYAWGDLFIGFSEMVSDTLEGGSQDYPKFPLSFSLNGRAMTLPCKLSDFLSSGWDIYDMATEDYLAMYETIDGFSQSEIILRKGNQEMHAVLRNRTSYDQELKNCDVEELTILAFSFMDTDAPNIDICGVRPRDSFEDMPKWMKKEREFKSGNARYHTKYEEEGNVFIWVNADRGDVHLYYSLDDMNRVEYISVTAQNR